VGLLRRAKPGVAAVVIQRGPGGAPRQGPRPTTRRPSPPAGPSRGTIPGRQDL